MLLVGVYRMGYDEGHNKGYFEGSRDTMRLDIQRTEK